MMGGSASSNHENHPPGPIPATRYKPLANAGDRYSSDIPDLDRMLGGGLYRGLTIALEFRRDFPAYMHLPFVQVMAANLND